MKLETANYSNKIMAVAIAKHLAGGARPGLVTAMTPRIGDGPGSTRIISAP